MKKAAENARRPADLYSQAQVRSVYTPRQKDLFCTLAAE
jgi:hypothetical protein